MNIILLALTIPAALLVTWCDAEYTVTGDHWAKGKELDICEMISEYTALVEAQDAVDMAKKYTKDCIYYNTRKGLLLGRQDVENAYGDLFEIGAASLKMDVISEGILGLEFAYLLTHIEFLDRSGGNVLNTTALVIFKRVNGGFQTHLKFEAVRNGDQ